MSLRMTICAVISLTLALGAHWVSGQAVPTPNASATPKAPAEGGGSDRPSHLKPLGSPDPDPKRSGSSKRPPELRPDSSEAGTASEPSARTPDRDIPPPIAKTPSTAPIASQGPPDLGELRDVDAGSPLEGVMGNTESPHIPPMIADEPMFSGSDPVDPFSGTSPGALPTLGAPGTGPDPSSNDAAPPSVSRFQDEPTGAPPMSLGGLGSFETQGFDDPDADTEPDDPGNGPMEAGGPVDPDAPPPSTPGPGTMGIGLPDLGFDQGGDVSELPPSGVGFVDLGNDPQEPPGSPPSPPAPERFNDPIVPPEADPMAPDPFGQSTAGYEPTPTQVPVSPAPAQVSAPSQQPPPSPRSDAELRTSAGPFGDDGPPEETPASRPAFNAGLADRLEPGPRAVGLELTVDLPPTANVNLPMPVTITLSNGGRDDVFNVEMWTPLPAGLEFIESSPPPDAHEQGQGGSTLVWRWQSLGAGDRRTIEMTLRPTRAESIDIVPHATSEFATKSRTAIQAPKLKIDLVGPTGEVIKGQDLGFNVTVQNVGDGPARNITLSASLTGGLQGYDPDGRLSDARKFEQSIPDLKPGESYGPLPLNVLAAGDGPQSCTVTAISGDVEPATPPKSEQVHVVVPKLEIEIVGPSDRPVGSTAEYVVTVKNTGTAVARDVAVGVFVPVGATPTVPSDARSDPDYEKGLHKIYWRLDRLDKGGGLRQFRLPVKFEKIQPYTFAVAANAQGPREGGPRMDTVRDQQVTQVAGIPDIKIVDVSRRDPFIDVGDETEFEIRIENIGSKEATGVGVDFQTSEMIEVVSTDPGDFGVIDQASNQYGFSPIDLLQPGVDQTFIVRVRARKPGVADFRVEVVWDGLPPEAAIRSGNILQISDGPVARGSATSPR